MIINFPQPKTQFEEIQESFNEVLKEYNNNNDLSNVAKDMQKGYMQLLSNNIK